jgi:5-methylcytosine-specific restriction endonuclease McrA
MGTVTALNQPYPGFHERAEALASEITELCSYLYAAEYQLLVKIREFDENGYWGGPGLVSCAHWLNFKCGMGMNAARERVRVARALVELPKISAAFESGSLSYSKVRAMTRIASPENEEFLLNIARHGTAYHVETLVRKYRRVQTQRDVDTANAIHVTRELSYYWDEDGALVFHGRVPAEQGALILKALEMQMEKQFQESTHSDVSAETPEEPEARSPVAAQRADALAEIAETYMNSRPVANSTADRYQVIVHVSEEATSIDDGPHVSAETSTRIGCDCNVIRVKDDKNGEPLSIGRRSRLVPPAIRRALRLRDDGCRFPGCTRRQFVDAHHIEHWSEGGETSLENLVQLCREHHRLVHEGGFGCERTRSGEIVFKDARERPLPHWSVLPRRNSENEAVNHLHERFDHLGIEADTCVPNWYAGDTCDWQMAVDGLLACEAQEPRGVPDGVPDFR